MREAGYGPDARIAVDDDYLALAQHIRRMMAATHLADAPEPKKGQKPQIPVPTYSHEQIMAELDLARGQRPSAVVAGMLDDRPLDLGEWSAIEEQDGG